MKTLLAVSAFILVLGVWGNWLPCIRMETRVRSLVEEGKYSVAINLPAQSLAKRPCLCRRAVALNEQLAYDLSLERISRKDPLAIEQLKAVIEIYDRWAKAHSLADRTGVEPLLSDVAAVNVEKARQSAASHDYEGAFRRLDILRGLGLPEIAAVAEREEGFEYLVRARDMAGLNRYEDASAFLARALDIGGASAAFREDVAETATQIAARWMSQEVKRGNYQSVWDAFQGVRVRLPADARRDLERAFDQAVFREPGSVPLPSASAEGGATSVSIANRSEKPLILKLRGPSDHDVAVPPRSGKSLVLPSGNYLVGAFSPLRDARPFRAFTRLEPGQLKLSYEIAPDSAVIQSGAER